MSAGQSTCLKGHGHACGAVHTLPRKFEAVHSTTTSSSRPMPTVRLATPATVAPCDSAPVAISATLGCISGECAQSKRGTGASGWIRDLSSPGSMCCAGQMHRSVELRRVSGTRVRQGRTKGSLASRKNVESEGLDGDARYQADVDPR